MMICDCDDDELAFIDATGSDRVAEIGSNGATGNAGDVDAISGEGFLVRFFDVGTEVGAGAGVGAGWGEAVVETGESASGDWAASARTCKAGAAAAAAAAVVAALVL
jgi:hypothetical protein